MNFLKSIFIYLLYYINRFIHNPAYKLDCLISSHPIETSVNDPQDVSQLFDIISYRKGASILVMLNNYLGIEDFKKVYFLFFYIFIIFIIRV